VRGQRATKSNTNEIKTHKQNLKKKDKKKVVKKIEAGRK